MRIAISLIAKNEKSLVLPVHYNDKIQGMIYRHLSKSIADWLHASGYEREKRRFKLFTFSRLQGRYRVKNGEIAFSGPVKLWVSSPNKEILESFALHLVRQAEIRIGRNNCDLVSVEVLMIPHVTSPLRVRALSPITVYSTLLTPQKKRKTYYYSPQETEFSALIIENLRKKLEAFHGDGADIPTPEGAKIRPVHVNTRHLAILKYKGTVIKGWRGIYELDMPESFLSMALDAGLGAKNSQGFGMVEVVKERSNGDPHLKD